VDNSAGVPELGEKLSHLEQPLLQGQIVAGNDVLDLVENLISKGLLPRDRRRSQLAARNAPQGKNDAVLLANFLANWRTSPNKVRQCLHPVPCGAKVGCRKKMHHPGATSCSDSV
jgi:hypothetical protein